MRIMEYSLKIKCKKLKSQYQILSIFPVSKNAYFYIFAQHGKYAYQIKQFQHIKSTIENLNS